MEDLVLKCSTDNITKLRVQRFSKNQGVRGVLSLITCDQDGSTIIDLDISQTRELIAHLTNCLKEVENG